MANSRKHRRGHWVIAVGYEHSPADLINRGFLPEDFEFDPKNEPLVAEYQKARLEAEAFDAPDSN